MANRFASIWFRHLLSDYYTIRQPQLRKAPFVLAAQERGRMVIKAASKEAQLLGVSVGMVVADARAVFPSINVLEEKPGLSDKLLERLAKWCICFTPVVAVDPPDGLLLDVSGCAHLWGGEANYLNSMATKLNALGYEVRIALAGTAGAAWAIARYGKGSPIIERGAEAEALLALPPAALRLENNVVERMHKLGMKNIRSFIGMQRSVLRRRFGQGLLLRIDQALGKAPEILSPVIPVQPYQERLPSLEPIRTATGIEIALKQLLETLCLRMEKEGKGLRKAIFKGYRIDGNIQQVEIGTTRSSRNTAHLFKLFEIRLSSIEPDLGIELFLLEAAIVEDLQSSQNALWSITGTCDNAAVAQLLDRLAIKIGAQSIKRYLPAEHHWPERSVRLATSLKEQSATSWRTDLPRPIHLLPRPEPVEVMVRLPDYPPVHFRYKGALHVVKKADGPERIEQEWWLQDGPFRDYYCVEDEQGGRYWLFRTGHYDGHDPKWFLHGFFA